MSIARHSLASIQLERKQLDSLSTRLGPARVRVPIRSPNPPFGSRGLRPVDSRQRLNLSLPKPDSPDDRGTDGGWG